MLRAQRLLFGLFIVLPVFLPAQTLPAPAETAAAALPDLPLASDRTAREMFDSGSWRREEFMSGDGYANGYWRSVAIDFGRTAVAPFHWDRGDWMTAGGVMLVAGVLRGRDQQTSEWFSSGEGGRLGRATAFAKPLGDGKFTLPLLAGFYLYGRSRGDTRAMTTARAGLESFLIAGAIATAGKKTFGRWRPHDNLGPGRWGEPGEGSHSSFPSGHTTVAFAVATVIARQYPEQRWVAPLVYSLATMTGISRIHDREHWGSDVFIGAAIGYFTGRMVVNRHGGDGRRVDWSAAPAMVGGRPGAAITLRW